MTRRIVWSTALALFVALPGCMAGYGQTEVHGEYRGGMRGSMRSPGSHIGVSYFYDALSTDGEWFRDPSYGWCWTPYDVSAEWRPYYDGHWEYTDYGWSWVSDEPWGWATYHYGRWFFDDAYGWAWVPGTEWAPAWVAWRYSDDWVGWAPLPPRARWDVSSGLVFADVHAIPAHQWCFVPQSRVLDRRVRVHVSLVARNVTLLARSRDATRFEVRDGRPINVGFDVARYERVHGRRVPRAQIIDVDAPTRGRGQRVVGGRVGYFRPTVRPAPAEQEPPRAVVERAMTLRDAAWERRRAEELRKLENDLNAERARLARDQDNERRARVGGPGVGEVRERHAAEREAFEAHAAQMRRVMEQRMQKQIVKSDKPRKDDKSKGKGRGRGRGEDRDDG